MADEHKRRPEGFQGFWEAMPCGEMMRKMMEAKKSGSPFNCAAMMSQMMKKGDEAKKESAPEMP